VHHARHHGLDDRIGMLPSPGVLPSGLPPSLLRARARLLPGAMLLPGALLLSMST